MTGEDIAIKIAEHEKEIGSLKHRMDEVEELSDKMLQMSNSVERLATNMEHMVTEQKRQGERLDILEKIPAEKWSTMQKTALTAVISAVFGALALGLVQIIAACI